MNHTNIEWPKNPDGTPGYIRISPEYIAGFFDGEGSAMILTIRRQLKTGTIYRFRPVIKIHQKTPRVLEAIKRFIGYGHIDQSRDGFAYIVNGLEGVLHFFREVSYYSIVKHDALACVGSLAYFQSRHKKRNMPYTKNNTVIMLDVRDRLFEANKITRNGLTQKYSRDKILSETTFIEDIEAWKLWRMRGLHAQK